MNFVKINDDVRLNLDLVESIDLVDRGIKDYQYPWRLQFYIGKREFKLDFPTPGARNEWLVKNLEL